MGIKYEQYIVMKLKFIREHFQIVNTQTILGNQTKNYEFFHRIYLWQNWSLCNLLFCSEIGYDQVFENLEDLETHLIEGSEKNGDNDVSRLSMDNMKSLFASKMVYSSHKHATNSSNQVCLAEACKKYPFMALLGFIALPLKF